MLRTVKQQLRTRVGQSRPRNWLVARALSRGYRRLDLSATVVAAALHRAGLAGTAPLRDKVCVEIGAGRVLTQSVVLHLLGAEKVIATDIARIAFPSHLRTAVREADIAVTHDSLEPFEDHAALYTRLATLRQAPAFSWENLADLGITYRAPLDLTKERIGEPFDFVFSESVLEHIPIEQIDALLTNLTADLRPGGFMIHRIHLEDHRSFEHDPFAFFETSDYGPSEQGRFGNRLRPSTWLSLFRAIPSLDTEVLFQWTRPDARRPSVVPGISFVDDDDLLTSNLGIIARKSAVD